MEPSKRVCTTNARAGAPMLAIRRLQPLNHFPANLNPPSRGANMDFESFRYQPRTFPPSTLTTTNQNTELRNPTYPSMHNPQRKGPSRMTQIKTQPQPFRVNQHQQYSNRHPDQNHQQLEGRYQYPATVQHSQHVVEPVKNVLVKSWSTLFDF